MSLAGTIRYSEWGRERESKEAKGRVEAIDIVSLSISKVGAGEPPRADLSSRLQFKCC